MFVSGSLGGAGGALRLLEKADVSRKPGPWQKRLIKHLLSPNPRVELGRWLLKHGVASAMIDLSDGLSSDVHHICELSKVGAILDASLLPIDEDLRKLFDTDEALAFALNGGEDFELLFTVPPEKLSLLENSDVTHIGTITETAGVVQLIDGDRSIKLQSSGYRHF